MSLFPLVSTPSPRHAFSHRAALLIGALLIAGTTTEAQDLVLEVEITGSQAVATLSNADLRAAAGPNADPNGDIKVLENPTLGGITQTASSLIYTPGIDFWTLGHDSFTYRVPAVQTGEQRLARVLIAAALHGDRGAVEDFEDDIYIEQPNPAFGLIRETESAMSGAYGSTLTPPQSLAYTLFELAGSEFGGPSPGNGGDCIRILPPPDNDGNPLIGRNPISLIDVGDGTFTVDLVSSSPLTLVLKALSGAPPAEQTVSVDSDADSHLIHLDWWLAEEPDEANGGAKLFVDGVQVAELDSLTNWGATFSPRRFVRTDDSGNWDGLAIDDVDYRTDEELPLPTGGYSGHAIKTVTARNDFQSGAADGWNAYPGFQHSVEPDTRTGQEGNSRLRLDFASGSGSALHQQTVSPLDAFSIAMSLDLSSLNMAEGDQVVIFGGADAAIPDHTNLVFRLHLVYQNGAYQLYMSQRSTATGPWTFSNTVPMTGTSARIAASWQAAGHQDRSNGRMSLWVDGAQVASQTGLANHGRNINGVRVGVRGVPTTFNGTVFVDDFELWTRAGL